MDRQLRKRLEARFAERLTGPVRQRHDQTEIRIAPSDVPEVMRELHDDPVFDFQLLADLMPRDDPRVPSLTGLWPGAEWMEREAYDMFGIIFVGNRDLRRIYMPPDYTSFPLRKDFYLPDDAARSPGGGVRHMEQTQVPTQATERV